MSVNPAEFDRLCHRMAAVRRDTHAGLGRTFDDARSLAHLGRHAWAYPLLAFAGGAGLGFLIARRLTRPPCTPSLNTVAIPPTNAANTPGEPAQEVRPPGLPAPLRLAWDLAWPIALTAAQSYLVHWLEARLQPPATNPPSRTGAEAVGPPRTSRPHPQRERAQP